MKLARRARDSPRLMETPYLQDEFGPGEKGTIRKRYTVEKKVTCVDSGEGIPSPAGNRKTSRVTRRGREKILKLTGGGSQRPAKAR